jgi:hypothetical protein
MPGLANWPYGPMFARIMLAAVKLIKGTASRLVLGSGAATNKAWVACMCLQRFAVGGMQGCLLLHAKGTPAHIVVGTRIAFIAFFSLVTLRSDVTYT